MLNVILTVDPSLTCSGYAYRWTEIDELRSGFCPVEEIGRFLDEDLVAVETLELWIEKPEPGLGRRQGGTFSTQSVSSAKLAWVRAVKRRWPRKNSITEITPSEWRRIVLPSLPRTTLGTNRGDLWKVMAIEHAGVKNHNEAEARCIMEYRDRLNRVPKR